MEVSEREADEICKDWVRLLTLVLGWSHDKAIAWARAHRDDMENPFFLHETTSWYILGEIITENVRRQTKTIGQLESKLDLALERFRRATVDSVRPEQVAAIRKEVREIIDSCAV